MKNHCKSKSNSLSAVKKQGELYSARVYGLQKDTHKEITSEKNVDIVCIATSDKGYVNTIRELRKKGKRVVVIGEDNAPGELRNACSQFIKV